MPLGRTWAVALVGLAGHLVEVESHLASGLPAFTIVGLPDASLSEARDRVRAAVASCGLPWPARRITVNLSPASLPKFGSSFDLGIAVATLAAAGAVEAAPVARALHLGELGLDGRVHSIHGVLPAVASAVAAGCVRVVVPEGNAAEARLVADAEVVAVSHLAQVIRVHGGEVPGGVGDDDLGSRLLPQGADHRAAATSGDDSPAGRAADLVDVLGQADARHALEVAAAGGHHLLLVGPPGAGKTMLAARLPGLLPDLSDPEAIEVTSVHSVAGTLVAERGLLRRPPFESPHHTATAAAVIGGGAGVPRPGAASRAHRGVLFLDEAPEFAPRVLETLRQPLEHGELVLHRARGSARYPARFQLVLAANPCPCGKGVGKALDCTCTPLARRRYLSRLSGPLLDRVDLQVEVRAPTRVDLALSATPEPTAVVAGRVLSARRRAARRLQGTPWRSNVEVSGSWLREHTAAGSIRADLDRALDRGALSLRGLDRVLRVAWTLADLGERAAPDRDDVGQALALRMRGRHG